VHKVTTHTFVHENVKDLVAGFRYDAHPMGMLASTVAALSTFYPDAKKVRDPQERGRHVYRLIAKIPTLAAFAYRHSMGLPYVYPDNELSYPANFLQMMFKTSELKYKVNPGPREGARRALHPARRPRAELLHLGHAGHRLLGGRPLLRGGRARSAPSTARSTAARTRRCCGCSRRSGRRTRWRRS
jgi:hypothetical protein